MEIRLTPELEQFVQESVTTGQFANPTEMINNALLLLKDQEAPMPTDPAEVAELRRQITVGIEQADRGKFTEFDAQVIKEEGRRRLYDERSS